MRKNDLFFVAIKNGQENAYVYDFFICLYFSTLLFYFVAKLACTYIKTCRCKTKLPGTSKYYIRIPYVCWGTYEIYE